MCEVKQGTSLSCPKGWERVACDSACGEDEEFKDFLAQCQEESDTKVFCSKTKTECSRDENVVDFSKGKKLSGSVVLGTSSVVGFIAVAVVVLILIRLKRNARKRRAVTPRLIQVQTFQKQDWTSTEL